MPTIRIDYEQVIAYVKQLKRASADCENMVRNLQTVQNNINDFFEGASAAAYIAVMQKRIQEIKELGTNMETLAEQIQQAADKIKARDIELTDYINRYC